MNINLKPSEKASDSILSFTQRLLGPIAEASDFLSDKIRFMRWKSAQKTLILAEEMLVEHGIEVKEVPVKFLVPFLEKCSLEEDESKLTSKWAELLVSAIKDYNHRLICYTDILAKLGAEEVQLLEAMWDKTDPLAMGLVSNIEQIYGKTPINVLDQTSNFHSHSDNDEIGIDEDGRSVIFGITYMRSLQEKQPNILQTNSYTNELPQFWLEHLGLVKIISNMDMKINFDFFLKAQLTPLGYSFIKSCRGVHADQ